MRKAVGVHLQGEQPTAEERAQLEDRAKRELGTYTVRRTVAYDLIKKKRVVRLDAIEKSRLGSIGFEPW